MFINVYRPVFWVRLLILGLLILVTISVIRLVKQPKPTESRATPMILSRQAVTKVVENKTIVSEIVAYGQVNATETVPIVAAVGAPVDANSAHFQDGYRFKKDELLIQLDTREKVFQINAAKSQFITQLVSLVAEFSSDYPKKAPRWQAYLNQVKLDEPLPELPENRDRMTDYRLAALGLLDQYFSIKQLEEQLGDFMLYAPFDGIVKTSVIRPGSYVSPGQTLGNIIDPLAIQVNSAVRIPDSPFIKVGSPVTIRSIATEDSWPGVIRSINETVTAETQSVPVILSVIANKQTLPKDGLYVQVTIPTVPIANVTRIQRSLLVDNTNIYAVVSNKLVTYPVDIILREQDSVLVRGLPDGSVILNQPVPGAYPGLAVTIAPDAI